MPSLSQELEVLLHYIGFVLDSVRAIEIVARSAVATHAGSLAARVEHERQTAERQVYYTPANGSGMPSMMNAWAIDDVLRA